MHPWMCQRRYRHYHRILHLFIRTRSQFDVTRIGTNSHPLCTSSRVRGFRLRMISLSITPCLNWSILAQWSGSFSARFCTAKSTFFMVSKLFTPFKRVGLDGNVCGRRAFKTKSEYKALYLFGGGSWHMSPIAITWTWSHRPAVCKWSMIWFQRFAWHIDISSTMRRPRPAYNVDYCIPTRSQTQEQYMSHSQIDTILHSLAVIKYLYSFHELVWLNWRPVVVPTNKTWAVGQYNEW